MLTYEEELDLSDLLVERRRVLDLTKEESREPNEHEREIISRGDEAAREIVSNYIPYISKLARGYVHSHGRSSLNGTILDVDDLVNEGTIYAMKCTYAFNARGAGDHRGVRFNTYAGPQISKYMKRYIASLTTPLKANITAIVDSRKWFAAQQELRARLRREPTEDEVSELCNVAADKIIDIPHRSSMSNLDNPDEFDDAAESVNLNIDESGYYTGVLLGALEDAGIGPRVVQDLACYMGLDRGYPRMAREFSQERGVSIKEAQWRIDMCQDVIIHPHYRMAIARSLETMVDPEDY